MAAAWAKARTLRPALLTPEEAGDRRDAPAEGSPGRSTALLGTFGPDPAGVTRGG